MRSDLQPEVQPQGRGPQSGAAAVVGEFPTSETGNDPVPNPADPPSQTDGVRPGSDCRGVEETAGRTRGVVARISRLPVLCAIGLIRGYQILISPWLPVQCRFQPSCSHYAVEAFRKRGFWAGMALTAWRLLRCQPLCKGGYDPVPEHGFRRIAGTEDPEEKGSE